ncbi:MULTISPECIES: cell division protein ZapA [Bacillaceae]|uniref:Cell division protein ZapA n=2 Tax=Mesobacillus TaxID=2675231 RepID=A0A846TLU1_9BACI|nr:MULTISPECIES: cell division protein ZapA [Bacillaceae]MBS8265150.1 cell division protein ZapA [Mesobacillus boroniphilus]MBT2693126.1 cell division protein ZapA [Bacillus sp. ISL-55]NKE06317.1 cell division protein ZapA [Mesobacillus selenatarsenatis]WLR57614.1 cell division protein ZapA [Mesobacillus subterraneus]
MSDTKKNKSTVDIYGQQYTIVGTESTSHIRLIASMVDDKMREIGSANPSLDTSKLAVLTAVNAVNDYIKMKDRVESLEAEIKRLKD